MSVKDKFALKDILGDPISREEAYDVICSSPVALAQFNGLSLEHQENILAFIQGSRGLPILYDGFYKYVLDPERHPERLESFLSNLFGQSVTIEQVLTREGIQIAEAGTLVVMDIVVRLSDGSIVDVEMQKYGYLFTGERSSCYMSDMVMRQYNRVRAREKEGFNFRKMKPVYLIVLMENSSKEFKKVAPSFVHRLQYSMDSGVELNLLTNLTYISLDTFRSVSQNIDSSLEAWLTFLSSDKPEDIIKLVEKYPEFRGCYHDVIMFRKKPEELMNMFSEALLEMDKNTVKYMIEEQQKEIETNQKLLEESRQELEESRQELEESRQELEESRQELEESRQELEERHRELEESHRELEESRQELEESRQELEESRQELEERHRELEESHRELEESRQENENKISVIKEQQQKIEALRQELERIKKL